MTTEEEKLYEKIQKLINLKQGAEEIGSMEEAANAQAQIQKLVLKYNLDLSKVPGKKDKQQVIIESYEVPFKKTESNWRELLLFTIARHNMGKAIRLVSSYDKSRGFVRFDIIGERINIDLIKFIYEQLCNRILLMRKEAYKKAVAEFPTKKNAYLRSYSRAVVQAISNKLADEKENIKNSFEGGAQLMVVNNAAVNEKVKETYGVLKSSKSHALSNSRGAMDGKRDGRTIQINPGLN